MLRRRGVVFFFKQKTAYEMRISDWSSDVCSSDLKAFARHVYPGRDTGVPEVVELPVIEGATQADIGRPGEEDLFKFNAQAAGRYTIETEGMTDVVMTLYSPAGILVAQDDDSGV